MPINISYDKVENHVDLIFRGNMDVSLSRDILAVCGNLSSCVKSCTIDLSALDHFHYSGIALLQVLYLRLSELKIDVEILTDRPCDTGRIPMITRMPSNPVPVRHPGQSVLDISV